MTILVKPAKEKVNAAHAEGAAWLLNMEDRPPVHASIVEAREIAQHVVARAQ